MTTGQQGTQRLTTKRAAIVDVDTTGNALYTAMTAAVPWLNSTTWSTNSYSTGQTNPGNADLHGAPWVDVGALAGTAILNGGLAGSLSVGGTVATNVAITDNPLNLGAQAVSAENAAVTATRKAQLVTDLVGKLIVLPYANPENFVSGLTTAMTGTTDVAITGMGAPGAGLRNYMTTLVCGNSHATVGTFVDIRDGSAGTVIYTVPAAAVYGGAVLAFPTPLRQPTTNTGLFAHDQTTGANVICSASGYKGA